MCNRSLRPHTAPSLAGCTDARRSPTRPPEVSEKTASKAVFMVWPEHLPSPRVAVEEVLGGPVGG